MTSTITITGIKELRDLLKYLSKEAGVGVFISSHLLSEMELMCDRIYIIDNGFMIGEKSINQQNQIVDDIFSYMFLTADNNATLAYFKELGANCSMENGGVSLVMKRSEIPVIIKTLTDPVVVELCAGSGVGLGDAIAASARGRAVRALANTAVAVGVVCIDRAGLVVGRS